MICKSPSLFFQMDLPSTSGHKLLEGALIIREELGSGGIKLRATSGISLYQYHGAWRFKGRGCLPPSKQIAPLNYLVSTQRLWMPNVKGVEGSFYAIAPFQVNAGGTLRGDFGIHFDANVPGSAGCCVIRDQSHWDLFRNTILDWREDGHQQIPLTVVYE